MQHYFRVGKLSHSNKFQQVSIKESSSGFTFSLSLFGIDEALLLHHSYDVIHLFRMFTNVNGPKDCIEMAILTIIDLLLSHSSMFFFSFPKIWSFFFNATSWTPHSCAKHKHDIRFSSNTIFKDNLSSFELSSLVAKSHHARSWYLVNESTTTITTATFKANLNVMSNGFLASLFGKWHVYSMFGLTLKFPS